jgi:hypothetical protein
MPIKPLYDLDETQREIAALTFIHGWTSYLMYSHLFAFQDEWGCG